MVPMLGCGEFAVRVWSPTATAMAYDLDVTAVPVATPLMPDNNEPDDTPAQCTLLTDPRLGVVNVSGVTLHDGLNEDWFCFTLGAQADIEISLVGISAAGSMSGELLDSSLNVINSGTLFDSIIPAGSYFIRVFPVNCGRVAYVMTVSEV